MTRPRLVEQTSPEPLDWPRLLAITGRIGIKVWHIDSRGVLRQVRAKRDDGTLEFLDSGRPSTPRAVDHPSPEDEGGSGG